MNIDWHGNNAYIETEKAVFTFETVNPREFHTDRKSNVDSLKWNSAVRYIDNFVAFPWGDFDNLPEVIQQAIQNNALGQGILAKKQGLWWGEGPVLYKEIIEEGKKRKELVSDNEIEAWLDDWDYEAYLDAIVTDTTAMNSNFTKFIRNKGGRVGKGLIKELEHVGLSVGRLAKHKDSKSNKATHGIINPDWNYNTINSLTDYKVYPLFDFKDPFKYPTTMYYSL